MEGVMNNLELVLFGILILATSIAWTINVRKTLLLVKSSNMTIKPNIIWLMAIPGINLVTQFYVIKKVAQSLYKEFECHKWNTKPVVASYHIGMMMGACSLMIFLPINSFFFWFCANVMFFAYWVGMFIMRMTLVKHRAKQKFYR
jgi:hypothetical protein